MTIQCKATTMSCYNLDEHCGLHSSLQVAQVSASGSVVDGVNVVNPVLKKKKQKGDKKV